MKKMTRLTIILCLVCVLVAAMVVPASACYTLIVGKDASETGRVMVTHNEDDGGRAMVDHGYVPPKDWPEGTVLPAEKGRAAIPQVSHTLGYYWSQLKPASGGYSNADAFYNDAGVLVVSNSNASSKVDTKDPSRVTDGGIEYNLRRVIAERATSARHGVEICIEMVETWGYAPSGRAYTIADKDEGWMVQIVSGKYYVAARCPDDAVIVMPNHYTIHELDMDGYVRGENLFYPDDLITYAKEKGFYEETNGKFDFAKTFQAAGSYRSNGNTYRQYFGTQRLLNGALPETRPDNEEYPFFVKVAAGSVELERLMEVMREHYEGTQEDAATPRAPAGGNPHDTTLRRICTSTTDESLICVFDETPMTTTLWTSFGHPCELPYIPLHPLAGIPKEIDQMEDSAKEMAEHLLPNPLKALYENSGWSKFRDFQMKTELTYRDNGKTLGILGGTLIEAMKRADVEAVAQAKENPETAATVLAAAGQKATSDTLEALQRLAQDYNEVTIQGTPRIDFYNPDELVELTFTAPKGGAPVESSLRFGMGMLNVRTKYITPVEGSLQPVDEDATAYKVAFRVADLMEKVGWYTEMNGLYDYFLGGETTDGSCFTGMTLADVRIQPQAVVNLTGPDHVTVDTEQLEYRLTVDEAEQVTTVTVELAVDNLVAPEIIPAEGWYVIASSYENGILSAVVGNNAGLNGSGEILTVAGGTPAQAGMTRVALNSAVMSAYQGESETFVTVRFGDTEVETTVDYSIYDVNRDGVVNQLDITRAQRHYGTTDEICDVNNDGEVNIADLILILNHYTK